MIKHDISKSYFNNIKDSIKKKQHTLVNKSMKNVDKIMQAISSQFNKEYGTKRTFGINDLVYLGVFLDKKNAVGFTMVATTLIDSNISREIISSSVLLLVNKKLLSVYVYKTLTNLADDKIWIEAKTKEFIDLILESNPTVP